MLSSISIGIMHGLVGYLLEPVIYLLLLFSAIALLDVGIALSERFKAIPLWIKSGDMEGLERLATRRIERSDFLARIAPMLGLMGTLIPLGPGLSALGSGELSILTTAMSVAFDTTVLGLLIGIAGFVLGRVRRRWYDTALTTMEQQQGA
ncbi:MAG: flagellar motor protein MotA [Gammaproteobacteria bacterium]|nr:MAG: flagellar motor protein MotA [Gammaproteobacteria bacterium]